MDSAEATGACRNGTFRSEFDLTAVDIPNLRAAKWAARGLSLRKLGNTHVGLEARMGSAAAVKVLAGLGEAEVAVDGQMHFRGVGILLAIVFPPANRA